MLDMVPDHRLDTARHTATFRDTAVDLANAAKQLVPFLVSYMFVYIRPSPSSTGL